MKSEETLFGRNPIYEVLRAGRRSVDEIHIAQGAEAKGALADVLEMARQRSIPIRTVPRRQLDQLSSHHQGVIAFTSAYPYLAFEELLAAAPSNEMPALFLILDLLQDPQNMGTLLRTAEAVGVHGVVLPYRRGVGVTPSVVNASSGASEHLRIATFNLARAIEALKQSDFWIAGLDRAPGAKRLDEVDLRTPLGLVVGSEGGGLRRLVRASCDFTVCIPMRGQVDSLNAAVAGSIALYEIWRTRGYPGG